MGARQRPRKETWMGVCVAAPITVLARHVRHVALSEAKGLAGFYRPDLQFFLIARRYKPERVE